MDLLELRNIDILCQIARGISDAEMHLATALKAKVKPSNVLPIYRQLTVSSQELSTAICILAGGYPINVGDDNAKADWLSKTRQQHVSLAKTYIDRTKEAIALHTAYLTNLKIVPDAARRLSEAYGDITHSFDFKQPHAGAFPDNIIRPHGDYPMFLNRMLFGLKYWRDWLSLAVTSIENQAMQPAWADAVIQYTNGVNCIHHCMSLAAGNVYLPIEADNFSRAGRICKLLGFDLQRRFKSNLEHWFNLGLRNIHYKQAGEKGLDAWLHIGLGWNELMKMPGNLKFLFNWEELEF